MAGAEGEGSAASADDRAERRRRPLARQYDAVLVPFFMEPLLGRPEWVQPDRIHPTAEGIDAMVAATVDAVAEALPTD